MSKQSKARARHGKREQQARQKQILMGVIGFIVVAVVILVISGTSGSIVEPEVAQDRLDLDPVLGNPNAPITVIEYGAYALADHSGQTHEKWK